MTAILRHYANCRRMYPNYGDIKKAEQTSFLPVDADPRYCALLQHRRKGIRPTHVLTIDGYEFQVCRSCACNYERESWAVVERIQEAQL